MTKSAAIVTLLVLWSCSERGDGGRAENGGTLVVAITEDPGTLFPPHVVFNEAKQITEQIYDYLAAVGPGLNTRDESGFIPALADRWRWSSDSMMLAFHINPAARWHDGRDVTARDIEFTFRLNRNPAIGSRIEGDLGNIDSVTITDSLTAVFWFARRSPNQFLDAAAQMLILPAHQLEKLDARTLRENPPAPVGSGRFRFRRWNKGQSTELVADTANYRGRARLDRVIWSVSPDPQTAMTRLLAGEVDLLNGVPPTKLSDLRRVESLKTIVLPGMDYAFLRFNLRDPADKRRPHPLFGDREMRRALAMALDRAAMARNVFDTFALVPVGPTVRAFPTTDPRGAQLPFDPARANRTLDSIGWVKPASGGIRVKNGRPLAFTLILPTSSSGRMRMGPLIQEQLRRVGARVRVEPVETSTQTDREARGDFDAALGAWVMPPSQDAIKGAWTTSGIGRNGTNYGAYSNPRFDALVDSALGATAGTARAAFSRAFNVINEDAPAVWLYEPKRIIGLHRRFRTAVMRPDAWWFDLAEWHIPPVERLPRDLIPAPR